MTRARARWPWGLTAAFVLGVVVFFLTMDPLRDPAGRVSAAAAEFAHSPVHVAEGAPVDAERIRHLIGERAMVVAVFSDEVVPASTLCDDLAELVPTTMVLVFSFADDESYGKSACGGPDFPPPTLVDEEAADFLLDVRSSAADAARYHDPDVEVTALVQEYVLAFDDEASRAYGALPRRGPIAEPRGAVELGLGFLAVVGSTITLYLVLRDLGWMLLRSDLARPRATGLRERLVRLADRIEDPTRPDAVETAQDYARAFRELDTARTSAEYHAVERRIERLEQTSPR